ncbi:MAG: flavodoxin domain-containing protein [Arthrobacter sp.]
MLRQRCPGTFGRVAPRTARNTLHYGQYLHSLRSVEGQTAQIADVIAELIRAHGHEAETADHKSGGDSLPTGYDGVIVAASVHIRRTSWRGWAAPSV